MYPFLATIVLFGGNFAPQGWMFCQGQLLSISQNTALFSLIGTIYGGDGQTTFGLPDFRGRIPVGAGSNYLGTFNLGQIGGDEQTTLSIGHMPAHSHSGTATVKVASVNGSTNNPLNNIYGASNNNFYAAANTGGGDLGGVTGVATSNVGASQPFNNHMPSLGLTFIIAVEGVYPSRN